MGRSRSFRRVPATLATSAAILALGLSFFFGALARTSAHAGWWDDLDKGEQIRLADLIADPQPREGKVVTFRCVYRGTDRVFFPYFTSFSSDRHVNFTVWTDGAPVWELSSYKNDDFPYLYMRLDHPQRADLLQVAMFTRIEVTGIVRDIYRGRPWIEVYGFRATPATLGQKAVEGVKTGDAMYAAGDFTKAESYYRRVLADVSLDETYALRVRRRLGDLLRAAGRPSEAADVEGGKILGGTPLPEPTPVAGPLLPDPGAAARSDPLSNALPGTPVGPAPTPIDITSGGPAPSPTPLLTDDLPGVPYGDVPEPVTLPEATPAPHPPRNAAAPRNAGTPGQAPTDPGKAWKPGDPSPVPPPTRSPAPPPAPGSVVAPKVAKPANAATPATPAAPPATSPDPAVVPATAPRAPSPPPAGTTAPLPPPPPRSPRLSGVK